MRKVDIFNHIYPEATVCGLRFFGADRVLPSGY